MPEGRARERLLCHPALLEYLEPSAVHGKVALGLAVTEISRAAAPAVFQNVQVMGSYVLATWYPRFGA